LLLDELRTLGLDWDRGAGLGEAHGAGSGAASRAVYEQVVQRLVDEGKAGDPSLSPASSAALYLKHPQDGQLSFVDRVFRRQVVDLCSLSAIALLHADGRPTPLLRQVVDDRRAAITHVIRHARWLPDTPRQLLLYHALGWEPPEYAHLPSIVRPDGTELRLEVGELVRTGYSGLAVANCLARLGWSPRGRRALLSLDELAARFELARVSRRPVVFDRRHLDWYNRRFLCALAADEVTALLVPHWRAAYGRSERAAGTALSSGAWQQTLALAIREELERPEQAVDKARFAFVDELNPDPASKVALAQPYAAQILEAFARELPLVAPFDFDPLDVFCRELRMRCRSALGVRSRDVMYVLRAALTGQRGGPCLVVVCQLLGPARCVQRAREAFSPQRREDAKG
jgi:glutamyl/glutaminyl-tRNA synthetase